MTFYRVDFFSTYFSLSRAKGLWLAACVVSLPLIFYLNSTAVCGEHGNELFIEAPHSEAVYAQQEKDKQNPTIKRSRYILVTLDLLRSQESSIVLNLFEDVSFTSIKDRIEVRSQNRYTWYGHIEGVEHSQVILVVEDGSLAGQIMASADLYQIRAIGGGVHGIYEIDQSAFPPHSDPIPVP